MKKKKGRNGKSPIANALYLDIVFVEGSVGPCGSLIVLFIFLSWVFPGFTYYIKETKGAADLGPIR